MGRMRMGLQSDGGMIRYTGLSLKDCIRTAFRLQRFQVEGPDWLEESRFDIVAKLPEGASEDQIPEMLQALLVERFNLSFHRDAKQHPIYALVAAKDPPNLTPAEVQTSGGGPATGGPPGGGPRRNVMVQVDQNGAHLKAPSMTLPGLAEMMSRFTDRPVVDKTGIEGQYDFDLVFSPDEMRGPGGMRGPMRGPGGPGGPGGPPPGGGGGELLPGDAPATRAGSIQDSVKKYGLKLDPQKSEMETLVVDHIEREPTEN
jgi:uncharacterized protein (TIGR03435 family)